MKTGQQPLDKNFVLYFRAVNKCRTLSSKIFHMFCVNISATGHCVQYDFF